MLKGKLDRSIVHLPEEMNTCPACQHETMEDLVKVSASVMRKCKKEFRTKLSKWNGKKICISCVNVDLPSPCSTDTQRNCVICQVRMSRYNLGVLCYCCNDNSTGHDPSDSISIDKDLESFTKEGSSVPSRSAVSTAKYISSSSPGKTMKLKGSGGKRRIPVLPCLREEASAEIENRMCLYYQLEGKYINLKKDRDRRTWSLQRRQVDVVYRVEQENLIYKLSGRISLLCEEMESARKEVYEAQHLLQRVSEIAKDVVQILEPTGNYTAATNQSIGWSINKRKRPKSRRLRKKGLSRKARKAKRQERG
jgi:hypothetical protein